MLMRYLYALLLLAIIAGCDFDSNDGSVQSDECALQWAEAFFNYNFKRAAKLTTPESQKWLRYAASNMTEEDLDVIRQQDEPAEVTLVSIDEVDDTTWQAVVEVDHLVMPDTIGHPVKPYGQPKQFSLSIVRRNKRMFVHMNGLPHPHKAE